MPKVVTESGSVRVDCLGGTCDLVPINLILPNTVTLNFALSLKAEVSLEEAEFGKLIIDSKDYNQTYVYSIDQITDEAIRDGQFNEMTFVVLVCTHFFPLESLKITLSSGAPAGSGLGGSSAMGITLYKALCKWMDVGMHPGEAYEVVNSHEARILDSGPAGYQDYQPALYGGFLSIRPCYNSLEIEQFYSPALAAVLENNLTLVYSGKSRQSGINNWEVFKRFFDGDESIREGLGHIAELANEAYFALKEDDFGTFLSLMASEGEIRRSLFPGFVTEEMNDLFDLIAKDHPDLGIKVCGAGGGGCFVLIHNDDERDQIREIVSSSKMELLPFTVAPPA